MNTIEQLPINGVQPIFKAGTCELISYAVFSEKGICQVSHETTNALDSETRVRCFLLEAKKHAII